MEQYALTLTPEQLAFFRDNGYIIIQGLLAPDEVEALRNVFMEQVKDGPVKGLSEINPNYAPDDPLARYPRVMHPHRHPDKPVGPLSMRYMLDRRFEAVLSQLFGEEPIAAQSMFYFKPPGARGQDLHQDNFYLRVKPGNCLAAWVAVDDADTNNGGMVVVPGSNRCDIFCPERADSSRFFTSEHVEVPAGLHEQPIRLAAGDVLFFNGSLIHGSYTNTSPDRFRRAFICHYIPRSSAEVSHWYRPLYAFDGTEVSVSDATGGGPCGTVELATAPH